MLEHGFIRAERYEVERSVKKLGERYKLPNHISRRGLSTQVYWVTQEQLLIHALMDYPHWLKSLGKNDREIKLFLDQSVPRLRNAVAIFLMDGKDRKIYCTDKNHLDHEMRHALAARSISDNGAFFMVTDETPYGYLEETVNDLVGLGALYPNENPNQIWERLVILREDQHMPPDMVYFASNFLAAMILTHRTDNPFTFQDLANHYFGIYEYPQNERAAHLSADILKRCRPEHRPSATENLRKSCFPPNMGSD